MTYDDLCTRLSWSILALTENHQQPVRIQLGTDWIAVLQQAGKSTESIETHVPVGPLHVSTPDNLNPVKLPIEQASEPQTICAVPT